MTSLDLATVTSDSFIPHIGETFEVVFADGRLPLSLMEARQTGQGSPDAARQPFVLTFHAPPDRRFPQQIYRVEHPGLGAMEIFLVQVSADVNAAVLEAIFG